MDRYVIQIKTGIYYENIVTPKQKAKIMFVGEGMNSTIITGSKNFVDGYTTFTSATPSKYMFKWQLYFGIIKYICMENKFVKFNLCDAAVIGNNSLERDLTTINASGPEKHQAVAQKGDIRCCILSLSVHFPSGYTLRSLSQSAISRVCNPWNR